MTRVPRWIVFLAALTLLGPVAVGQWGRGRRREIRPEEVDRQGLPVWQNNPQFEGELFTFVRVRYSSYGGRAHWGNGKWATDYPDSDLNFSFRLQQLTTLKVDPHGKILELTDDQLFNHPFLYLIEPGHLVFDEAEIVALRKYLLNGGFLMVDDFWGEDEWENFRGELKRVFPDRDPLELPLEHEIFHCVYDLQQKPQIPSIHAWMNGQTTERWDAPEPHYKALFDDRGRMMVIICHNTDLGDGWEREGIDRRYFHEFSEKWAYPMGINILTYAMTH
ncbi:MAG: DUF4159 domain-containing protein [Planctomycetaceae bacterium]|jgi:hypothetical protein